MVCVNCRGIHVAGDHKCAMQERQVEVSRVRVVQKLSYGEAAKKGQGGGDPERSNRSVPVQRDRPTSDICFSMIRFFAFIVTVINCINQSINQSNVFIMPFLHQPMSQSAVQKPSLKPKTASNADVEAW